MTSEDPAESGRFLYPPELMPAPEPPPGSILDETVHVTMRDGIRVGVDVYRPSDASGPLPALFSTSPYMKDLQRKPPHWSHAIESGATAFYNRHGYVHVIAQGRGAGRSQGRWEWFGEAELTDGYDLIEWIAAQQWCDGNVGMIGDSYFSWSQYAAAAAQPPHLRCICVCDASIDLYRDVAYQGGLFNSSFIASWVPYHLRQIAWPGPIEGKETPINLLWELVNHPRNGPWYERRSARARLSQIEVPVFSIAPQGGILHYRGQLEGYELIEAPKKLYVAPPSGFWSHLHYLTNPGLNRQMLRWYDHWLKGIDTGIMDEPEVAIFDSGTLSWRYEERYPMQRTEWTPFYFAKQNGTGEVPRHALSAEAPDHEERDPYSMPESYGELIEGRPALSYVTTALDHDLRLGGRVSVNFHASCSQPDTAFYVKLVDVAPDGRQVQLSRGFLRASFREVRTERSKPGAPWHDFTSSQLLEPERVYEFQIELSPVFHTIVAGHQLAVNLASEDLEYNNPTRDQDVLLLPWPVTNTIFSGPEYPSHVLLPVVPEAPEIAPVSEELSAVQWPLYPGPYLPHVDGFPLEA